jgi:hypothetical protein
MPGNFQIDLYLLLKHDGQGRPQEPNRQAELLTRGSSAGPAEMEAEEAEEKAKVDAEAEADCKEEEKQEEEGEEEVEAEVEAEIEEEEIKETQTHSGEGFQLEFCLSAFQRHLGSDQSRTLSTVDKLVKDFRRFWTHTQTNVLSLSPVEHVNKLSIKPGFFAFLKRKIYSASKR